MSTRDVPEVLLNSVTVLPPPVFSAPAASLPTASSPIGSPRAGFTQAASLSEASPFAGRLWWLAPELVFDEASFEIRLREQAIPLQPQVVELIGFLVRNEGRLVTKAELIQGPWRGTCVTESALHRAVMLARRALQQAGHGNLIATVRGRGFRLKAVVASFGPSFAPAGLARSRTDGRRLVGSRVAGESGGSEVWELRTGTSAQRIGILSCVRLGSSAHVTCTVRRGTSRSDLLAFIDVVVPPRKAPGSHLPAGNVPAGNVERTLVIAEHDELTEAR